MGKRKQKSVSSSEEYVVESILDKKVKNGETLYKIKWEGYSEKECTWEPTSNLSRDLIKKYEKTVASGSSSSENPSAESPSVESPSVESPSVESPSVESPSVESQSIESPSVESQSVGTPSSGSPSSRSATSESVIENKSNSKISKKKQTRVSLTTKKVQKEDSKKRRSNNLKDSPPVLVEIPYKKMKNEDDDPETPSRKRMSLTRKSNGNLSNSNVSIKGKVDANKYEIEVQEEVSYDIEKIVGHRIVNGVKEYRIRWQNYSQKDDTWQTADTFDDPKYIDMYEKKVAEKSKNSKKSQNGLLEKLLNEARNGNRCESEEIGDLISQFEDGFGIKYYLVLLKNKDIAFVESHEIPVKFNKECAKIKNKTIRI